MKRISVFILAAIVCQGLWAFVKPTCTGEHTEANYYVKNPYYAYCADYSACKLSGDNDGTIDFNWQASIVFGKVYVSEYGDYNLYYRYKAGSDGGVKISVNGGTAVSVSTPSTSWAEGQVMAVVSLTNGENTIRITQDNNWPLSYSIQLEKRGGYAWSGDNDYFLSNMDYAVFTSNKATTKVTSDGNYLDYDIAKGTPRQVIYDGMGISTAGGYDVIWYCSPNRAGNQVKMIWPDNSSSTYTTTNANYAVFENIHFNAGSNTVKVEQVDGWALNRGIKLIKHVDLPAPSATADYYITHRYHAVKTALTPALDEVAKPCYTNSRGEYIKKSPWGDCTDFHWSGTSSVVFEHVNMSKATEYTLMAKLGGVGTVDIEVNGIKVQTAAEVNGVKDYYYPVTLNKGDNTIRIIHNTNWAEVYSIQLYDPERKFHHVFRNTDGSIVQDTAITMGDSIVFSNPFPRKASQGTTAYVFSGWTPTPAPYAYDDATYTATYTTKTVVYDQYLTETYRAINTTLYDENRVDKDGLPIFRNIDNLSVKKTKDGQLMDYHWEGKGSSVVYDYICLTKEGYYDVIWYTDTKAILQPTQVVWPDMSVDTVYNAADGVNIFKNIHFAAGENTITFSKVTISEKKWPLHYGIQLAYPKSIAETEDYSAKLTNWQTQTLDTLSVTRAFTAGMWNTICLPFDVDVASSPLSNCQVAEFTSASATYNSQDGVYDLRLVFQPVTTMQAGVPYIIQPSVVPASPMEFVDVPMSITAPESVKLSAGTQYDVTFHGLFIPTDVGDDNPAILMLGSGNTLYYPSNSISSMKGMRGYFHVTDKEGSSAPVRMRTSMSVDPLNTPASLVQPTVSGDVHKFVYNGQLIIVRNGAYYTIQGQQITNK